MRLRSSRVEERALVALVSTMLVAPALAALGAKWGVAFLTRTATWCAVLGLAAIAVLLVTGWAEVVADIACPLEASERAPRAQGGGV